MIQRALLLSVLVLAPLLARADFVIRQKIENAKLQGVMTTRIKGEKARVDTALSTGTVSVIMDLRTGEEITLIPKHKAAFKISTTEFKQRTAKLKAGLAAQPEPPPPHDTGQTAKVGGYQTEIYTWTNINGGRLKLWVAKHFPDYKRLTAQLDRLNGFMAPNITKGRTRPDPATLPGMVMKSELLANGTNLITSTLLSAKETPVAASVFEIPKGYQVTDVQQEQQHAAQMRAALKVGAPFPAFNVQSLKGKPLSLADYRGKVVLIDFWATWCPPCREEVPQIVATYRKYHAKGFDIIGVSLDQDRQTLLRFTKAHGMTWPQFFDGRGWDNKLAVKYGIQAIPATFLLNGQGKIIGKDLRGAALTQAVAQAVAHR